MAQKTNTMAILGLIFAFVAPVLGLIFSIIALKQIKRIKEGGKGLAIAGLIISIIGLVIGLLWFIVVGWIAITADYRLILSLI